MSGHPDFQDIFTAPVPLELRSATPSSSSGGSNSPSLIAPSPSFSTREFYDPNFFATARWSPNVPQLTSSSFPGFPYGSLGASIRRAPYPITLPTPSHAGSEHDPAQHSVDGDGYTIIRYAIPAALVREVVALINKGLPVNKESETAQTYVVPIQAFRVRDAFISVCSIAFIRKQVLTSLFAAGMAFNPPTFLRPDG